MDLKIFGNSVAFSLAEVLITLGIIGVVVSMTLPNLIANYQKEQTVTQLKNAYNNLSQAIKLSEIDNGPIQYWDWGDSIPIKQSFKTYLAPYLKITKYCSVDTDCGYSPSYIISPQGGIMANITSNEETTAILSDGSLLIVRYRSPSVNIFIDTNANKKPNILGKDVFMFAISNTKGLAAFGEWRNDSEIRASCAKNGDGTLCSTKIIRDGWKIADDYPW